MSKSEYGNGGKVLDTFEMEGYDWIDIVHWPISDRTALVVNTLVEKYDDPVRAYIDKDQVAALAMFIRGTF